MIENLDNEDFVVEIRKLVNDIESAKDDFNVYCELVKEMFISGSKKN